MPDHETPLGGETRERRHKGRHRAMPLMPEVRLWDVTRGGLEVRDGDKKGNLVQVVGQPIVYDTPYAVRDMFGEFSETMRQGVASASLARGADVRFLLNHDGLPMARTIAGTLSFEDSTSALRCVATLDLRSQLSNDFVVAVQRGDLDQMSVGFTVARDEWDEAMEQRDIFEFGEFLDVSGVTYPASPTTSLEVAQRMAMRVPVETRARARRVWQNVRAGRPLTDDQVTVLRELMLDPGAAEAPAAPAAEAPPASAETDTPAATPEGDGGTAAAGAAPETSRATRLRMARTLRGR